MQDRNRRKEKIPVNSAPGVGGILIIVGLTALFMLFAWFNPECREFIQSIL